MFVGSLPDDYINMKHQRQRKGENPTPEGRIGEAEVQTQIENAKAKQGSKPNTWRSQWNLARVPIAFFTIVFCQMSVIVLHMPHMPFLQL